MKLDTSVYFVKYLYCTYLLSQIEKTQKVHVTSRSCPEPTLIGFDTIL